MLIKKILLMSMLMFSCSSFMYNEKIIDVNTKNDISLQDKIAQMIMVRIDGNFYNNDSWKKSYLIKMVKEYKIGGFITFGGSIHGTYSNIKFYQEISKIPLFIAADYERGLGTFIDGTLFPPNMALAATGNPEFAFKQGEIIAKEALSIGVNMIFAPVVDINNNSENPIINIRSYVDKAQTVEKYSIPFIKGLQSKNIISCSKHYPGHGNTSTDSHTSLPIINISKEDFIKTAFQKDTPEKKSLFFKGEVKEIAQKIMGQHYKKIRFKYWLYNSRSAWILNRIGKVRPITAGFIIDNCKIASVHVLVYRESHGWEIKYPLFRDQFEGVRLIKDYTLNKKIDGITGATLSVNSMKKMTQLALAMHNKIPDIGCT